MDAIATPFVQGHLQQKPLSVTINTECAHCHQPMQIELNGDLSYHVEGKADPIVYMPFVDFGKLRDPSIIDAF